MKRAISIYRTGFGRGWPALHAPRYALHACELALDKGDPFHGETPIRAVVTPTYTAFLSPRETTGMPRIRVHRGNNRLDTFNLSLSLSSSHVIKPLTCSRFSKLKQENGAGCLSRERERELGNLGKIEFRAIFDIQLMLFFHVLLRFLFYFIASLIFPQFLQTLNNFQNDKNVCVFFLTN